MSRGGGLLAVLTAFLGAQSDLTTNVIPLAVPMGVNFIVEHSDTRSLPEGGTAIFQERSELSFADAGGALIASTRPLGRTCSGPAPICESFARLGASIDGRVFHFRIGMADLSVTALETSDLSVGDGYTGQTAAQVAAAVAQSESNAPGAILAADLRQMIRFAGVPLPALGATAPSSEGQIRVREYGAAHALVVIERTPHVSETMTLHGSGECRVSRANGLTEACRFVDWLGDERTTPIRIRETRITQAQAAVP
jgi:hypothetical protein